MTPSGRAAQLPVRILLCLFGVVLVTKNYAAVRPVEEIMAAHQEQSKRDGKRTENLTVLDRLDSLFLEEKKNVLRSVLVQQNEITTLKATVRDLNATLSTATNSAPVKIQPTSTESVAPTVNTEADEIARLQKRGAALTAEIGQLVAWLCHPIAHNITGSAIPIEGGWTSQ